jgi:hypothetical protein
MAQGETNSRQPSKVRIQKVIPKERKRKRRSEWVGET